ncbi:protocatechuate 3,4-dioxygenase subunit beta [Roseitranquillus sediminis]|uniref:protocatechuate 3,4-dioxygenase subunit beta n=1 Tax=Roseitranquillus sediminis TaxID=2809051 RepID=UPI001D0C245B|nr:protocatechuate 3,4-dioxygenase subunit beta [Roseitranquillus sediminis]MBM9593087.1 protocatechuate 3,4-dioxygenase subunit beta [Roseitranquillus sediminis]
MGSLYQRDFGQHPLPYSPGYKTTVARSPSLPLLSMPSTITEETGPVFGHEMLADLDNDLTCNFTGRPAIGERIIVHGRVTDQERRPQRGVLIEVWQANAGGRYRHRKDGYLAPLDPDFGGCGRCITDDEGRYEFHTIKPGAYPWPNGTNDWRPAHIHFSIFGTGFGQRLITQMYFEGDPLIPRCPIIATIPDPKVAERLVAPLDMAMAMPMDSLAYRFDIVLRGRRQTTFENRMEGL